MSNVVEHLSRLVHIPSVSAMSNRSVIDYATSVLTSAEWTVQALGYVDDRGTEKVNLIAAPPGQNPTDQEVELALFCHTDTVPYAQQWSAALQPVLHGDALHGCGSCDVKGFLACLLAAAEHATARSDGLRIVLTADEEIGCVGSQRLIATGRLRPRRAVVGEPTSLHVARAGKGYCLARIVIYGREAHSAHPEQGISAIYAAAQVIAALEELAQQLVAETHPLFHPAFTTLNIGTIAGGTAKNIVPGRCELLVEWRPIPGDSADHIPTAVETMLRQVRTRYRGIDTAFTILRQQQGFETPPESTLVRRIEAATRRAATAIPFGSEASLWSTLAEEIVVFGPGDMRTAHSERECVPIGELEQAVAVVNMLMGESLS